MQNKMHNESEVFLTVLASVASHGFTVTLIGTHNMHTLCCVCYHIIQC